MKRRSLGRMALLMFAVAGALYVYDNTVLWSADRQERDPVGYVRYSMGALKDDADAIRRVRVQLQQEIVRLTEEEQRVTVAQEFAASSAVEFRNAFTAGRFPALVAGSVWSRDQVESQVSSLLAQVAGFDATLVRLRSGRIQAESELERLTIQLADTESSVTLLGTQGEVLRARRDAQPRTEQLVNRVDELVNPRGLESI